MNLMTTTHTELLGLSEIAELYKVHRNTANNWSRQRDFPLPVAQLKMGPVWARAEVVAWKRPEHYPRPGDCQYVVLVCSWCGEDALRDITAPTSDSTPTVFSSLAECEKCQKKTVIKIYNNFFKTSIQTRQYAPKEDA